MTRLSLRVVACATLLWGGTVLATPTAQQKCDNARVTAWAKYVSCVDAVVAKDAKGVAFNDEHSRHGPVEFKAFWKCRHKYFKKWASFQGKAKYAGSTCDQTVPAIGGRYTDNGDGTVTDNLSGLMWEKKDNYDGVENYTDPHDADNYYTWSTGSPYKGDGTGFTSFLTDATTGLNVTGFAGANDWRLPTLAELQTTMLDFPCVGAGESATCECPVPCVDPALGVAADTFGHWAYMSSTSYAPDPVIFWGVDTAGTLPDNFPGYVGTFHKLADHSARAVRGGL